MHAAYYIEVDGNPTLDVSAEIFFIKFRFTAKWMTLISKVLIQLFDFDGMCKNCQCFNQKDELYFIGVNYQIQFLYTIVVLSNL